MLINKSVISPKLNGWASVLEKYTKKYVCDKTAVMLALGCSLAGSFLIVTDSVVCRNTCLELERRHHY